MVGDGDQINEQVLQLASFIPLNQCTSRGLCSNCKKSRKFYCYKCLSFVGLTEGEIPNVMLPLECHIIKHIDETDSKSTAVQAYLLSKDVSLFTYPGMIPPYTSNGDVIVCFPYEHALTVDQYVSECLEVKRSMPKIVLFLDGTWSNVQQISPFYSQFPAVKLTQHNTCFWRTHLKHIPNNYLSTIEAIYYFFLEFSRNVKNTEFKQFDNLLYFFMYHYMSLQSNNTNLITCHVSDEIQKYLMQTYKSESLDRVWQILALPPKWTTLRINKLKGTREDIIKRLTLHFQNNSEIYTAAAHERLFDVITIEGVKQNCLKRHFKEVIIDLKCAKSVLRGADVYAPGVKGIPDIKSGSLVSVCVDVHTKCCRGEKKFKGEVIHIANGVLELTRFYLFKNIQLNGVAVRVTETCVKCPSLNGVLPGEIILQNIPSIVVCHVLDPQPWDTILDMCSAPGGKTTHIASLMGNTGTIIALEKVSRKVEKMRERVKSQGITSITIFVCDSTTCFSEDAPLHSLSPPFGRERFDRILLDPPCSALGQRPMLVNNSTLKDVISYLSYQWCFVSDAVKMLRPGGILVYSTCTLPVQENECIVARVLRDFPCMELLNAEPFIGKPGIGITHDGLSKEECTKVQMLSKEECAKVQRFDPWQCEDMVDCDTIGFFIAKLRKKL